MSNGFLSYGAGIKIKEKVCVEINSTYTLTGAWTPIVGGVQGIFINTIGQQLTVQMVAGVGGIISAAGANFVLSGGVASYTVTVTLDRKYEGKLILSMASLDNSPAAGVDRLCDFSIGTPDTLASSLEVTGNCIQSIINTTSGPARDASWEEIRNINTFTFIVDRFNLGSTITCGFQFIEKSMTEWLKLDSPSRYKDPLTDIEYTNLPTGVFEVLCQENNEVAFYDRDLCYKITSPISYDFSGNPMEAWDAYSGIRPRTDGVPIMQLALAGASFMEFDPTGRYLYSLSGANLVAHQYKGFSLISFTSTPINFIAFPAAAGYTAVGLAVHPITEVIYVLYMDPGPRRLYLCTITTLGVLQLVGDCQFTSSITAPIDAHDIVFSKSGQLLMAHGSNLYYINSSNGIINPVNILQLTGASNNAFAIRNISRYYNGDLHLSGADVLLGNIVLIYNGETYTKVRHWASNNSTTPPDSSFSIAYPINPEVKFTRLFVENVETGKRSPRDLDIFTGQELRIPPTAVLRDCSKDTKHTGLWTEDFCYVIDKNIISQGITLINAAGQIVSNACNPVGGFVPPAPLTYSSLTHNLNGDRLYALNAGGTLLDTYDWSVINAPVLLTSLPLTGLVSVAETEKSLRTRWTDDTLWLMTEVVIGASRFFRFYIVNKATGALTLQGTSVFPGGGTNNGHFAWGIDDNIYFSYNIGGGTYRVSKLSKISYEIQSFVLDANYVIDNINIDLPNQRIILAKSGVANIDFYSYGGQLLSSCVGATPYADAIHAPFGQFKVGDTTQRVKKIFVKDSLTGFVDSYYHDYLTGEDVQIPPLARAVICDNSTVPVAPGIPRFDVITGIVTWSKALSAPNAKAITITRIANNININDGITGVRSINAAFSQTWSANQLGGNMTVAGTAAGSSFIIAWTD